MDKRAFLAIALSILILVIYQEWMTRYYGTPTLAPEAEKKEPERAPVAEQSVPAPSPPTKPVAVTVSPEANDQHKTISVKCNNYIALFTNQWARLKSFNFKNYRSSVGENTPPFDIVQSAPGVPLPLGIRWQSPAPFDDEELLYSVQGNDLKLAGDSKDNLIFSGRTSNGTVITKTFTFFGSTYPLQFEVSVSAAEGGTPVPEVMLTAKSDHSVPNPDAHFEGFIALVDNKIRREPPAEIAKGHEFAG